jgi:putative oxidoreductase
MSLDRQSLEHAKEIEVEAGRVHRPSFTGELTMMRAVNFLNDLEASISCRSSTAQAMPRITGDDPMIDARTAPYGLLILRVALGALALAHGLTKIFVFGPAGTVGFFESLGYPAIAAWFVMAIETGGGLALILGFYPRLVALLQLPVLLGATLVHLPNGWSFSATGGGYEFPLFWSAALLALALTGPGAFTLREMEAPALGTVSPRTA